MKSLFSQETTSQSIATQPSVKPLKVAFIPLQRLGDGVITLLVANNLHQNHYDVTMFHGFMQHLNDWFDFSIQAYPTHEQIEKRLQEFDLVLMDQCIPYVLEKDKQQQIALSQRYIFFAAGRMPKELIHNHSERLQQSIGLERLSGYQPFATVSRAIKYHKDDSMVDNMVKYCQLTLKLSNVSKSTGIHIPDCLKFQKHKKRVVIAPTSSLEKKNWGAKKFIALARHLKKQGYEPVFALAMNERKQWQGVINNEFLMPEFPSIKHYAEYLYESLAFVGNDSGGGHVASMMGIPVLTIVSSPRKINFKWRPGWGTNTIVAPFVSLKFMGKRYWQNFLLVRNVLNAFYKMIKT
jgi:ADP-heptose:LPS heptosyltransferase